MIIGNATVTVENVLVCIIMQRLTRHVSVIRMTNRRRGGHVDLRVAVIVIKRFQFLFFESENVSG